jgi:DNA-binding transcriptional LysR family regulator
MDTRFLESFVYVVELGSISAAARHLDLTAASVAQRLKSLEASVGSHLIVRSGRTVKPTVAGVRVMAHAHSVLRAVRDLQSAASTTELPAGPLRLGAIPTAMTGMLPPILREWVSGYPQIEIYIEPAATVLLHSRVLAGELDAALLVHPQFDLPKSCSWTELRRERLILLTPARMRVEDPLETIATQPFILYDRKVVGGKMADGYLKSLGIRPFVRFELDGIESIAKLVAEGLGVSVLPDWATLGGSRSSLRRWSLPEPCPFRRVGLLSLRNSVRAPLVSAFAALAARHYQAV